MEPKLSPYRVLPPTTPGPSWLARKWEALKSWYAVTACIWWRVHEPYQHPHAGKSNCPCGGWSY